MGHVAGFARATALLLATAGAGLAHDGPHAARVVTDVLSARQDGREVAVTLRIEALDGAVHLQGMWAASADSVTWTGAAAIDEGAPRTFDVVVRFDGPVPGLFTLTLDFGEGGLGPVPVIPK